MEYQYPKISNTLWYKRVGVDTVEVTEYLTESTYTVSPEGARFMRQLDGYTYPYHIETTLTKGETDALLDFLDENGLTRESDAIRLSFGTILKAMWVPKRTRFMKMLAVAMNMLLLFLWLPILVSGVFVFVGNIGSVRLDGMLVGFFLGLFAGALLHEFGHAFAGIAYGARVFEMGVGVMYCVLPIAYVLLDQKPIKRRMRRVQINAAGAEANFLLAGLFLLLSPIFPSWGGMLLMASINNVFLGALNLTFIKGLDGTAIVSELLGVENLIERARAVVFDKKVRRRFKKQGASGYATVTACYLLCIVQVVLPILFAANVLEVIAWFV